MHCTIYSLFGSPCWVVHQSELELLDFEQKTRILLLICFKYLISMDIHIVQCMCWCILMKAGILNEALFERSFDTKSREFGEGQLTVRWVRQRWNWGAEAQRGHNQARRMGDKEKWSPKWSNMFFTQISEVEVIKTHEEFIWTISMLHYI